MNGENEKKKDAGTYNSVTFVANDGSGELGDVGQTLLSTIIDKFLKKCILA